MCLGEVSVVWYVVGTVGELHEVRERRTIRKIIESWTRKREREREREYQE